MNTENPTPETKAILDLIQISLLKMKNAIKSLQPISSDSVSNDFFNDAFNIIESSMVKIGATPRQEVLKAIGFTERRIVFVETKNHLFDPNSPELKWEHSFHTEIDNNIVMNSWSREKEKAKKIYDDIVARKGQVETRDILEVTVV